MARPPNIEKSRAAEDDLRHRLRRGEGDCALDLGRHFLRALPTSPPEASILRRAADEESARKLLTSEGAPEDVAERVEVAFADPSRFFLTIAPTLEAVAFDARSYDRQVVSTPQYHSRLLSTLWTWGVGALLHPAVCAAFAAAPARTQSLACAILERRSSSALDGARGKDKPETSERLQRTDDTADAIGAIQDLLSRDATEPNRKAARKRLTQLEECDALAEAEGRCGSLDRRASRHEAVRILSAHGVEKARPATILKRLQRERSD